MKKYVLPLLLAIVVGMLLGTFGYCGLTFLACFMDGSPRQHPVAFPMSILGSIGCAAAVAVLMWRYIALRKKYPSISMTVVDITILLVAAVPALLAWSWLGRIIFI